MLFKFTDAFAGAMTVPFIIDIGFTRNDYAIIVKGVGLAATLIGGFAGGFLARGCSLVTCLWIGGLLQAVSNLTFTWLALVGPQQWALTVAVSVEAFTGAIGTVIFVAYLSALCKIRCTPPRNTRCSPRWRPSAASICLPARAMWRRRRAGRCSS